ASAGNRARGVRGRLPLAVPELARRPVAADVAVDAGAPGQRQRLRGRAGTGGELRGDDAARHPEHGGAVAQDGGGRDGDDDARADIVADAPAAGEELVVED